MILNLRRKVHKLVMERQSVPTGRWESLLVNVLHRLVFVHMQTVI